MADFPRKIITPLGEFDAEFPSLMYYLWQLSYYEQLPYGTHRKIWLSLSRLSIFATTILALPSILLKKFDDICYIIRTTVQVGLPSTKSFDRV